MKFYCVTSQGEKEANDLLAESCHQRKIDFVPVLADKFNLTEAKDENEKALLYRTSIGPASWAIEKFLTNEKTATFYQNYKRSFSKYSNVIVLQKMGVPIPKTVSYLPQNKDLLKEYVNYLGGFPIIVKAEGGSHGVGVMKIDSLPSLLSVADYLLKQKSSFLMREFIKTDHSARLIVIGDKVVDSIEYSAPKGDFRSNEGKVPNVKPKKFSAELQQTAIKAVKALDIELGGVDILVDEKGNGYVAEVNFPCFFVRCQVATGQDISGMIVDYLLEKAEKN
ncbi:MAG: ATP-grasp domain-containing protein [Parcubacteria group bacterium]|nr:ATP-grasp domain-containing protein [Parcubacteria group bacterium]